jgi:hypothetical protein
MNKVIITGTGRCGTSVLMQLLTHLGFNTGYSREEADRAINKMPKLRAGIEHSIESKREAYILKNPAFAQVNEFKRLSKKFNIDYVYIPIRKLEATAKSRDHMQRHIPGAYGGFWLNAHSIEEQKTAHAKLIYNLIEYLEDSEVPFSLISFPHFINHPEYLYNKLSHLMQRNPIRYDDFKKEFSKIIKPDFVRF